MTGSGRPDVCVLFDPLVGKLNLGEFDADNNASAVSANPTAVVLADATEPVPAEVVAAKTRTGATAFTGVITSKKLRRKTISGLIHPRSL